MILIAEINCSHGNKLKYRISFHIGCIAAAKEIETTVTLTVTLTVTRTRYRQKNIDYIVTVEGGTLRFLFLFLAEGRRSENTRNSYQCNA